MTRISGGLVSQSISGGFGKGVAGQPRKKEKWKGRAGGQPGVFKGQEQRHRSRTLDKSKKRTEAVCDLEES